MSKIRKLLDEVDLSKKYPKYINKNVFRVVFLVILLFTIFSIAKYGLNVSWVYVECNSLSGCENPYISCQEDVWVVNPDCEFYSEHPCKVLNCDKPFLEYGEYIGEKPPFVVKNGSLIIIGVILFGFIINHIIYKLRWEK